MTISAAKKILGIVGDYDEKSLQKAIRDISKKYHPDSCLNLSEEDKKKCEILCKQANSAYALLLQKIGEPINQESEFDYENWESNEWDSDNWNDQVKFAKERFRYECNYLLHLAYTASGFEKYMERKQYDKKYYSEAKYVNLCIQTDLIGLNRLVYTYSNLKEVFPIVIEVIEEAIDKILELLDTKPKTYSLLSELDQISIECINHLHTKYCSCKFDKEKSYAYNLLSSIYNAEWNKSKDCIHRFAHDCNFNVIIRIFMGTTILHEKKLEEMLMKEQLDLKLEAKRLIENAMLQLGDDHKFDRKLMNIHEELIEKLFFFDQLLNKSFFGNSYIDKDILLQKKQELYNYVKENVDNLIKEKELEEKYRVDLLTVVDHYLDTLPNVLDFLSESDIAHIISSDIGVQKRSARMRTIREEIFRQLLQKSVQDVSKEKMNELDIYIYHPDFKIQLSDHLFLDIPCQKYVEELSLNSKNKSCDDVSVIDSLILANCYENYIMVSPEAIKELYANSIIPDFTHKGSVHNGKRTCLFLDKKYDRLDYFFALQIIKVEFSNGVCKHQANFVKVDKKGYNLIQNAIIESFKQLELREPTVIELKRISEVSVMMSYTLQTYGLLDNQDNSNLLEDAMSLEVVQKKLNGILTNLKRFMNEKEWETYRESMKLYVNIDKEMKENCDDVKYINEGIVNMFTFDFTQSGTLYFDNRLCSIDLFNGKQVHSLKSQREMEKAGSYTKKQ